MILTPVSQKAIDELPDVHYHFQADQDFRKIYETSPEAGSMCDIASLALQFAANMGKQGGLGALGRMVATSDKNRFMLFSLNSKQGDPPGPRIFGVTTDTSSQINEIADTVTKLI